MFHITTIIKMNMKIRFANKVYEVKDTRIIAGGLMQYAIEDEPNHIDWVSNVEVLDGATYKVKDRGLSYPKATVKFD